MLRRSTNVFCSVRKLMRGWISARILCSCGTKLVKSRITCGDCSLATTARTPSFSKNRCPRPRSMWQPRSLKNSFDNKSGAPPGTTYTSNTPLTPAIPTGNIARVLFSSVSSLPRRKVMAFASWIRCVFRPPSSYEHPFPLLKSTLSNQETRASCVNHSIPNVTWGAVISSEINEERCFHLFTIPGHLFSFVWTFARPVSLLATDAAT